MYDKRYQIDFTTPHNLSQIDHKLFNELLCDLSSSFVGSPSPEDTFDKSVSLRDCCPLNAYQCLVYIYISVPEDELHDRLRDA